ncbi:MAG: arginine N-succinyltransferase [Phycisphaerales bacterium]|nr:arginine N-succinyltransferase [Phycisphaerales bacterium]
MFIIRQANLDDLGTLVKLAKMVHFINLPADKDIITNKVLRSRDAFMGAAGALGSGADSTAPDGTGATGMGAAGSGVFMFVLEDSESGACLGTSQVVARMGGKGNPNYSWKLTKREFFSKGLQTGTSHTVATLHTDESGPTEIGGLILQPASRGAKLGRLLSLIRFHFIALHRRMFADRVIAEMMAPITLDGQNMLWEFLGRRFIPLSYTEADKHCQRSREFISALLPKEDIYLSLLPPEARDVVGRVGEETVPARKMLEKLGFEYRNFVDPFDGGPHLEVATDSISIVKNTRRAALGPAAEGGDQEGLVSTLSAEGEFRGVQTAMNRNGATVGIPSSVMEALGWEQGQAIGVTPLGPASASTTPKRRSGDKRAARKVGS